MNKFRDPLTHVVKFSFFQFGVTGFKAFKFVYYTFLKRLLIEKIDYFFSLYLIDSPLLMFYISNFSYLVPFYISYNIIYYNLYNFVVIYLGTVWFYIMPMYIVIFFKKLLFKYIFVLYFYTKCWYFNYYLNLNNIKFIFYFIYYFILIFFEWFISNLYNFLYYINFNILANLYFYFIYL